MLWGVLSVLMAQNNKVFAASHTLLRYPNIGETTKPVFFMWSPTFLHSTEAGIFFSETACCVHLL